MNARDIMTSPVISVSPEAVVRDIARLLLEKRISAVPVIDADETLVGIISEGDLISHAASGNFEPRRHSRWLDFFSDPTVTAQTYVKHHGRFAHEVMTREVITVPEDTPLPEIAYILESKRVKRVPVVREGRLVGIISRANLLKGLTAAPPQVRRPIGDAELREVIENAIDEAGVRWTYLDVMVSEGVAHLSGYAESREELDALRVVLENVDGLKSVQNDVSVIPARVLVAMGGV